VRFISFYYLKKHARLKVVLLEVVFFSFCFIKKIHKKIKKNFWKKNQKDFEKK